MFLSQIWDILTSLNFWIPIWCSLYISFCTASFPLTSAVSVDTADHLSSNVTVYKEHKTTFWPNLKKTFVPSSFAGEESFN